MRELSSFLLTLALLWTPPVAAEDDGASPIGEGFGDVVEVNVVNVEVYVTDSDGRPLTGLTADDFEVFENRRPMKISNFYAVEDGRKVTGAAAPDEGAETSAPAPPAASPGAALPVPENERLRLVVFVDNFNIRPNDRKRITGQLNSFLLRNVGRDDLAMLVTYDRSLKVRQPFTNDPALVADALEALVETRGEGGQYDAMRSRILADLDDVRSPSQALAMIRPYADSVFHDVNQTISALKELIEFLAGLPGRKMVLHVSSGIPMVAAADLFAAVEDMFDVAGVSTMTEYHVYDTSRGFEELGAQANAHGVTFSMLDAAGLRTSSSGSAEHEGLDNPRVALNIDSAYEANLQAPLYFMAEHTGGTAILNQNDIRPALGRLASDFRNYYSLGYMPGHAGDGRFYHIDVKVRGKGLRVRHREGYRDQDVTTRMTDGTRAALLHVYEQNPLAVSLAFGQPETSGNDRFVVPIQVRIPVGKLVLVPVADGSYVARVRVYIGAVDEKGRMSEVQEIPLAIKIPGGVIEAARGEQWLYNHKLLMRRGRQRVALGVRDELGAEESFLSRLHQVGG